MEIKKTFNSTNSPLDRIREIRNDIHECIRRNTTTMWVDSLEYTLDCIVVEDVEFECMGEDENDSENYDHHPDKLPDNKFFNGGYLYNLLDILDRELFPEEYKGEPIPPNVQLYWNLKQLEVAHKKLKGVR